MGSGPIFNGSFDGNISGTGQINLPAAVAQTLLPSLYPPPPSFLERVTTNLSAAMGLPTSPPTPGGQSVRGDSILPDDATSSSPFFSATPTLQPSAVSYSATATCSNLPTACWLTTPTPSGTIPAFGTTPITANFNPGNLPAGVYPADLKVTLTSDPSTPPMV
jgi:hypothetical protein